MVAFAYTALAQLSRCALQLARNCLYVCKTGVSVRVHLRA